MVDRRIGHVDTVSSDGEITGWIVDHDRPEQRGRVELVLGDLVLAQADANRLRADLPHLQAREVATGFRFEPSALWPLLRVDKARLEERLAVRSTQAGARLGGETLPKGTVALAMAQRSALRDLPPSPQSHRDVIGRLRLLLERAQALTRQPLGVDASQTDGFVEEVFHLADGLMAFAGWMQGDRPIDASGLVLAGTRFPIGLWGLRYRRDDLPDGAQGFIAIGLSEHSLPASLRDGFILVHGGRTGLLRVAPGALPRPASALLPLLEGLAQCDIEALQALRRLIRRSCDWLSAPNQPESSGISFEVDSLMLVPGFGGIAQGWCVRPWQRLTEMTLKVGRALLFTAPGGIACHPRLDLRGITPRPDVLRRAGFTAVFRGAFERDDLSRVDLRLSLEQGDAVTAPIDHLRLRTCRTVLDIQDLFATVPGIAEAPFAAALARGFASWRRSRTDGVMPLEVAPCATALAVAVSADRDIAALQMARVREAVRTLPDTVGLALLAGEADDRAVVQACVAAVRRTQGRPVSVFLLDDAAYGLEALPIVLAHLQASAFVYCGPDALPAPGAVAALAERMRRDPDALVFARSEDAFGAPCAKPSSQAFGWSTAAFSRWAPQAPLLLQGHCLDNGLAAAAHEIVPEARVVLAQGGGGHGPVHDLDAASLAAAATASAR